MDHVVLTTHLWPLNKLTLLLSSYHTQYSSSSFFPSQSPPRPVSTTPLLGKPLRQIHGSVMETPACLTTVPPSHTRELSWQPGTSNPRLPCPGKVHPGGERKLCSAPGRSQASPSQAHGDGECSVLGKGGRGKGCSHPPVTEMGKAVGRESTRQRRREASSQRRWNKATVAAPLRLQDNQLARWISRLIENSISSWKHVLGWGASLSHQSDVKRQSRKLNKGRKMPDSLIDVRHLPLLLKGNWEITDSTAY